MTNILYIVRKRNLCTPSGAEGGLYDDVTNYDVIELF